MRKLEETREKYMYTTAIEHSRHDYPISRYVGPCQRNASINKALQHKIDVKFKYLSEFQLFCPIVDYISCRFIHKFFCHQNLLNDIKEIKGDRMGHTTRVILLKKELEYVRKNIRSMEKEYERVYSWRMTIYKCLDESPGAKGGSIFYSSFLF